MKSFAFTIMKKALVLSLLTIITFSRFSQNHKLIDESKKWVMQEVQGDINALPPDYDIIHYFHFFAGDSIVNGVTYAKLYHQQFHKSIYNYRQPFYVNDTLQMAYMEGLLREDTLNQRAYKLVNGKEELLFDFSVQQNDTILLEYLKMITSDTIGIVDSVRTVLLANQSVKKSIHYNHPNRAICEPQTWIESVGSPNGILNPFCIVGLGFNVSGGQLICHFDNGGNIYGDCNYPRFVTGTEFVNPLEQVFIYPNPVSETLFFTGQSRYSIFNLAGQLLVEGKGESVNVNKVPNGLFTIELVNEKGAKSVQKILKI
jgi:hypothetical protein